MAFSDGIVIGRCSKSAHRCYTTCRGRGVFIRTQKVIPGLAEVWRTWKPKNSRYYIQKTFSFCQCQFIQTNERKQPRQREVSKIWKLKFTLTDLFKILAECCRKIRSHTILEAEANGKEMANVGTSFQIRIRYMWGRWTRCQPTLRIS